MKLISYLTLFLLAFITLAYSYTPTVTPTATQVSATPTTTVKTLTFICKAKLMDAYRGVYGADMNKELLELVGKQMYYANCTKDGCIIVCVVPINQDLVLLKSKYKLDDLSTLDLVMNSTYINDMTAYKNKINSGQIKAAQ